MRSQNSQTCSDINLDPKTANKYFGMYVGYRDRQATSNTGHWSFSGFFFSRQNSLRFVQRARINYKAPQQSGLRPPDTSERQLTSQSSSSSSGGVCSAIVCGVCGSEPHPTQGGRNEAKVALGLYFTSEQDPPPRISAFYSTQQKPRG